MRVASRITHNLRRTFSLRNEHGAASALSTFLMIAVSVGLVGAAAVSFSRDRTPPEIPHAEFQTGVSAGQGHIEVLHTGGDPLDLGDVVAVVSVNDKVISRGPAGAAGVSWQAGDSVTLPLPSSLPAGARAEVSFVHNVTGTVIGTLTLDVPAASATTPVLPGFDMTAQLAGGDQGPLNLTRGALFRIDAEVNHPEGRKQLRYVYADLSPLGGQKWIDLTDDGTNGDLVAGDGIYGVVAIVPGHAPPGGTLVTVHAVDLSGARASFDVTIQIPTPPPPPTPTPTPTPTPNACFRIRPDGGVEPLVVAPLTVKVVGVDITYGRDGPRIPVHAAVTLDRGVNYRPFNNGDQVARGMTEEHIVAPGHIIGVRGNLNGFGLKTTYTSFSADPHVRVLKNGDTPPDVPAFGTIQTDIAIYLAPYVQNGKIHLAPDEAIVLIEFASLGTAAADFQDLVVLFDFDCTKQPTGVTVTPYANAIDRPCSSFAGGAAWTETKVDPPRVGAHGAGSHVVVTNLDGKSFDWSSTVGVHAIYVKGSTEGSFLYRYDPASTGGAGVTTPGGAGNAIKSITFCHG